VIAATVTLLLAVSPESYFDQRVAPILTKRCLPCHNRELNNANLSFQDPATTRRVIVPGQPDNSMLIQVLKHEGQIQMPPGPPLPKKEIQILREWVRRGAMWGRELK
jgi:hypothetical protein